MSFLQKFWRSRWGWYVRGLPSLPRANALFSVRSHTMSQPDRCRKLWDQTQTILRRQVPGDLVECGVWRGGSSAIMGLAARAAGQPRDLHLFDSFEGLPEPTAEDGASAADYTGGLASGALSPVGRCEVQLEEVRRYLLGELQFDPARVHFHVGWFQHTVPAAAAKLGAIAVLRLDGDWYESTRVCLDHLYPKLVPGGLLVLDDYFCWAGCRKATDEYRQRHQITTDLIPLDTDAACWLKE